MVKHDKTTATAAATSRSSRAINKSSGERTSHKRDASGNEAKALYELKFDALRSALYHGSREHWLSFLHRCAIAAGLLAGATAITSTLDGAPKFVVLLIGVTVSMLTVLDLVFDWSGTAIDHVKLRERFYGILAEIEQCERPESEIVRFRARLAEAYQEEPPIYHALNEIMWNRAYEAMSENLQLDQYRKVTGWRRFFAQVLPQRGHDFT